MSDEVDVLRDFNPTQQAAILMLAVGKESATKLMKELNPREVQSIGNAMSTLPPISRKEIDAVLRKYVQELDNDMLGFDPTGFAHSLLNDTLGENASSELDVSMMGDQLKGLETLKWMNPIAVAGLLKNEHPQVMAIVLSYFEPDQAAAVLDLLPKRFQSEVLFRIASLTTIQPQALFDLNAIFERQSADSGTGKMANIGGVKRAAEILNMVSGGLDAKILDEIAIENADVSQEIQDKMFTFENIIDIDSKGIQATLAEVPADVLVLALKAADQKMRDKFLDNMSKRQGQIMRDDLENAGPAKLSDVEAAQRTITSTIRRLANEGKVIMPGAGEPMV
jgi:flagellar motor switch protein FliG